MADRRRDEYLEQVAREVCRSLRLGFVPPTLMDAFKRVDTRARREAAEAMSASANDACALNWEEVDGRRASCVERGLHEGRCRHCYTLIRDDEREDTDAG